MIYSITEGQQAEEYKKRKIDEKMKQNDDAQIDRHGNPYTGDRDRNWYRTGGDLFDIRKGSVEDNIRRDKVDEKLNSHTDRLRAISKSFGDDNAHHNFVNAALHRGNARDAINRHMRRHPNQYKESCGLFANVSFI